jgi:hypothetical protein
LQIARGEIDGWRGQCMDVYAKSERAIASTLEQAIARGRAAKPKHLAGQRLAELESVIAKEQATTPQTKALSAAISSWHVMEDKRAFLAHGVLEELVGAAEWWAIFDVIVYDKSGKTERRWALSQREADQFQEQLIKAFSALSGQLGQLRQRMALSD